MAKTRKEVKQDSQTEDDFGALFQHYLLRRTERLLDQVAADDQLLDEEVRSKALAALEFALENQDAHALAGKLLLAMAPKMERAGFRDEWMVYVEKGINACKIAKDVEMEAELLHQLGFLCQLRAMFDASEQYLKQSIEKFIQLQLARRQAASRFRLAYVYWLQRKYDHAFQQIEQGFSLISDEDPNSAHGHYLRGQMAHDNGDYAAAIDAFQRSLKLYETLGNKRMVALRLGNIGLAYTDWKRFEEAFYYCNQSICMFEEIQDISQAAGMKMNLGNIYLLQNDPALALQQYVNAEQIFRKISDERHLTLIYLNSGIAYGILGEWQKAEQYLVTAIDRWQQYDDIHSLVNTMDELGTVYEKQGCCAKARSTYRLALKKLLQIRGQPGYENLYKRVSSHLQQLKSKQSPA